MRVRATCKQGHTSELEAPKGRVTWRGVCQAGGCTEWIIARRFDDPTPAIDDTSSDDEPSLGPGDDGGTPAARSKARRTIKKVTAYNDAELPDTRPGADGGPPAVPAAEEPTVDPGPGGSDDDEGDIVDDDGELVDDGGRDEPAVVEPAGRRRLLGRRRARRPEVDEWLIPGVYG